MADQQRSILFMSPYPHAGAPGQRFRYEQYYDALTRAGFRYDIRSFLDEETNAILYKPGHIGKKVWGTIKGYLRRIKHVWESRKYDFVFLYREASPLGPPIFEFLIAKVLGKKLIYDYDDAIWLHSTSESNKLIGNLKWSGKVKLITKWAYKVSCGNDYLRDFALQYNAHAFVNPTTIDTEHYHNKLKDQHTGKVVVGWTGSNTTMGYLDLLVPIISELEQQYEFEFVVISDKEPELPLKSLRYIKWNKDTEVDNLLEMNFGLMPLSDDPWSRGKCGFKALQYMSLGMPAIAAPVGVNSKIIDHGHTGYLCITHQEWKDAIEKLLTDTELRVRMGKASRERVEQYYSVSSNTSSFLGFFA